MDEGQPILLTYLKDLDLLPVAVFEYLPQQHGSPQQSLWGLRHFIRASLTQRFISFCSFYWLSVHNVYEPKTKYTYYLLHPKQGRTPTSQAVQPQRIRKPNYKSLVLSKLRNSGLIKTRTPREVETCWRSYTWGAVFQGIPQTYC